MLQKREGVPGCLKKTPGWQRSPVLDASARILVHKHKYKQIKRITWSVTSVCPSIAEAGSDLEFWHCIPNEHIKTINFYNYFCFSQFWALPTCYESSMIAIRVKWLN